MSYSSPNATKAPSSLSQYPTTVQQQHQYHQGNLPSTNHVQLPQKGIQHQQLSTSSTAASSGSAGTNHANSGPANANSGAGGPGQRRPRHKSKYGMFEDIEEMMYGFGDKWPPQAESVDLIEELAVSYIQDLCRRAMEVADYTGKLDKQCFMYAVRKDSRKFSRAYSLLKANEELKKVQNTTIAEEEEKIDTKPPAKKPNKGGAKTTKAPEKDGDSKGKDKVLTSAPQQDSEPMDQDNA